jgi:hypothetical protein
LFRASYVTTTHVLRGVGTLLMLVVRGTASETAARVTLYATPGVPLRTVAGHLQAESNNGWRSATWVAQNDEDLVLEDRRPDLHDEVRLVEILDRCNGLPGYGDAVGWAQDGWIAAVRGWCAILAPSNPSPVLKKESLERLDDAFLDAAEAWGDAWVNEHFTEDMRLYLSEQRVQLGLTPSRVLPADAVTRPPASRPSQGKRRVSQKVSAHR